MISSLSFLPVTVLALGALAAPAWAAPPVGASTGPAAVPATPGGAAPSATPALPAATDAAWLARQAPAWRRWLTDLNAWGQPRHDRFVEQLEALRTELRGLCTGGGAADAAALARARERLDAAHRTWRELEALQLGAAVTRRSSKAIDFWPTRPSAIEQAARHLAGVPLDGPPAREAEMRWGTATRGLPAIEWLLHGDEPAAAAPLSRDPALCRHAQRSAVALHDEAVALRDAWRAQGEAWAGAEPAQLHQGVRDVVNLLIGSLELLRGKKLQRGARVMSMGGAEARPALVFDAWRSGRTHAYLMLHADAMAQVLLGRPAGHAWLAGGPASGLVDQLAGWGLGGREAALRTATQRVHAELLKLPRDPLRWTLAGTAPAARALQDLRARLDPEVAQALRMRISFTDADGD